MAKLWLTFLLCLMYVCTCNFIDMLCREKERVLLLLYRKKKEKKEFGSYFHYGHALTSLNHESVLWYLQDGGEFSSFTLILAKHLKSMYTKDLLLY